jgi:hypothetical protein
LVGLPAIVPNTWRYTGGTMQFQLQALGLSQATVLVSSNLSTWQTLQSVPLVAGYGICQDSNPSHYPVRFFRVRVP